ncbi:Polyketide synthase, enoylreductase [Penicillium italicum]|uniref:Polyketide synthase, enoylreductase n=1 Tax=Penicillium italicum TaxID=40296 RepID=A0A0A2KFX5_PENIT|nr:Polyketide synthase, enoylreductase [Penicillium italicum]
MATHRAITVQSQGKAVIQDRLMPQLTDDCILVKTTAVSLNPTDWKHLDFEACTGTVIGCDYAGVVEAVGPAVQKVWKRGDRVAGFIHGCDAVNPANGAFSEYALAKGDLQIKIPDYMSFEAACTIGLGILTVGFGLYHLLGEEMLDDLENINDKKPAQDQSASILIYGGATATGSLAIQVCKLLGLQVITTCSEVNRAFMYELGADAVFDYHDAQVGDTIRQGTGDSLEIVFDTISTPQTAAICAAAISSTGGAYNALLDVRCPRLDVDTNVTMTYDIIGDDYQLGGRNIPGDKINLEFGVRWVRAAEILVQSRRIFPHRYAVKPSGLAGILDGLQLLRQGKVRACKLVYKLEDTS